MAPLARRLFLRLTAMELAARCAAFAPAQPLPTYVKVLTLGVGKEWRFNPLVIDINGDGHLDLVATARLVKPSLHMWLGDGKGNFTPIKPTWSDIGYAALATGDINGDGFPDIVAASHFGAVQTLLSDGKGDFTEKILQRDDGCVAAQLADVNADGHLDLILVGYRTAGIEIYYGDGTGNWKLHATLPEVRPGPTMPGRALAVGDLNGNGHLDLVAAFQRWGICIYSGDGKGRFTGGPATFRPAEQTPESLVLGDVNKDGHPDIVVSGNASGRDRANGPDVYLNDGHGGWRTSSAGLKILKVASEGIALGDLDRDGNLDIVAAGNMSGDIREGWGLFWFRGDGKGGWSLVPDSGLPNRGLSVVHSITLADVDHDGLLEIIVLSGGDNGAIAVWKRQRSDVNVIA